MKVSLKKAFSLIDGRLSTKIEDVYEMLNFIFSENFFTHQLPTAMKKLKEINPRWFDEAVMKLDYIKQTNDTNDFAELMKIIDSFHSDYEIELEKIDNAEIKFSDGLVPSGI